MGQRKNNAGHALGIPCASVPLRCVDRGEWTGADERTRRGGAKLVERRGRKPRTIDAGRETVAVHLDVVLQAGAQCTRK